MTITNKNTLSVWSTLFAVLVLVTLPLSVAHATEGDVGGYSADTFGGGWYDVGSGYTPAANTGWYDVASGYTPVNDTGWYDVGSGYTPSYSTPSYSNGYGSGYSTGGYSTGGYSTGGGYTIGTPIAPHPILYPAPISTPAVSTPSNTYAPTTVNTCTGNSCNSDDHSVVNITNPAPVINNNNVVANYQQPVATQQYCQSGYYGTYPNCYINQQPPSYPRPPVVYNTATPYVSLSQVPYTGLELGFWGTIAYWGAFVLFALFAAYLIAIKRVQNNIANYLKSVLFGTDEEEVETTETAPATPSPASAPVGTEGDTIDSFIMSQINRARHA